MRVIKSFPVLVLVIFLMSACGHSGEMNAPGMEPPKDFEGTEPPEEFKGMEPPEKIDKEAPPRDGQGPKKPDEEMGMEPNPEWQNPQNMQDIVVEFQIKKGSNLFGQISCDE